MKNKKQKINCDVNTCKHNNCHDEECRLEEIKVSAGLDDEITQKDNTICDSYEETDYDDEEDDDEIE